MMGGSQSIYFPPLSAMPAVGATDSARLHEKDVP